MNRRNFIKKSSIGLAAMITLGLTACSPKIPKKFADNRYDGSKFHPYRADEVGKTPVFCGINDSIQIDANSLR